MPLTLFDVLKVTDKQHYLKNVVLAVKVTKQIMHINKDDYPLCPKTKLSLDNLRKTTSTEHCSLWKMRQKRFHVSNTQRA